MVEPTSQLEALLTRAAFAPIQNMGWIRVTGEDRVRWLNGMVTNSIQALKPGEGCYNFFLNAQGRIQGDCTAWMFEDFLLIETAADRVAALLAYLDRFIIMDDVELSDESGADNALLLVAGPEAAATLNTLGIETEARPLKLGFQTWQTHPVEISTRPGKLPAFEIFGASGAIQALAHALTAAGLPHAGSEALEHLRLLEAVPLYGIDIRDKELPQETALSGQTSRALHFAKGCYLGQEIVERIRSRGQVNRLLTPLTLSGQVPTPGTPLIANEKPVGEITSAADVPGHGILALGYVRREVLDARAALTYPGGTALSRTVSS